MSIYDYGSAIQIDFDLPIATALPIVTGTEEYLSAAFIAGTAIKSNIYSTTYTAEKAFDGSTATSWRSNSTAAGQWIGKDFGQDATLVKFNVTMNYSSGRINSYKVQGSANGIDWTDVAIGNFANASGAQAVTFDAATYRYWRLLGVSKYSTYTDVTELQMYSVRPAYDVTGWTVTGYEPAMSPEGALIPTTYTIRKISKTEDSLAVILWLNLSGRMKYPQGLVTVAFTGSLQGPGNAAVAPFTLTFTPTNITPIFNPHGIEKLDLDLTITTNMMRIYYESYQSDSENISLSVGVATAFIHIDDLEQ